MNPNSLPSERIALMAALSASSSNAAQTSVWADAALFRRFLAVAKTGVLGASATVDFKLQQAKTSGGGSAKDITGAAIVQIVKASGDNKVAEINLNTDSLDTANGFRYVAMVLTVGTAASLVDAELWGLDPFNAPASDFDIAGVAQIVSA